MFKTIYYFSITVFFLLLLQVRCAESETSLQSFADGLSNAIKEIDEEAGVLSRITGFLINRLHIPGTKWCGSGNLSTSLNDLGSDEQTDICCRNHDLCPFSIKSGAKRFGLYNNGNFYRSHCNCDKAFYKCLKETDHYLAQLTGQLYFNILAPPCFKLEYLITDCKNLNGKCIDYKLDEKGPKSYQWFENPIF